MNKSRGEMYDGSEKKGDMRVRKYRTGFSSSLVPWTTDMLMFH